MGALGAAALAVRSKAAERSSPAKSEKKKWAHEYLKGLGCLIMPSFTPDFKSLDENGIRLDIQHSIKQGFSSCAVTATGATKEQSQRITQIVVEETRGNKTYSEGLKWELAGYPASEKPQTEDDVYNHFRQVADSSSNAIVLYGTPVESLRRFDPSGIPVNVFDRLADHPNVVAVKLTHPMSPAMAFELCERLSDRLILAPVNLDLVPVLAKNYKNVRWSGMWISDAIQSPEKPYGVEFMDLINKGQFTDAMKVYWQMQPLVQGIYDLQAPLLLHGMHPWAHMKYFQWVTGGNGGLLPLKPAPYLPTLDAASRELIKSNFAKCGITPLERPEEEFMVGRAAYSDGVQSLPAFR